MAFGSSSHVPSPATLKKITGAEKIGSDIDGDIVTLQSFVKGFVLSSYSDVVGLDVSTLGHNQPAIITHSVYGGLGKIVYSPAHGITFARGVEVKINDDWLWVRDEKEKVSLRWYCDNTGATDCYSEFMEAVAYAKNNNRQLVGGGPDCYYRVSAEIVIDFEINFDGQMCQIFQETANQNILTFDKGLSGAANYQNALHVKRLLVGGVAGTGDAFTFVNCNESHFENLYVVGVGRTAFANKGSLLSKFDHIYAGNGLTATPGFFTAGHATGNVNGLVHSVANGLGPNCCTYNRPSMTNSTGKAYDIDAGNNCVFIEPDAEGISSPAIHMQINRTTTVIGGNMEGTGSGVIVNADNCAFIGMNNLSFLSLQSGVKGNHVTGGTHKYPVVSSGTNNNTLENFTVATGGTFSGITAGVDNIIKNITDASGNEIGKHRSFTFTPLLEFGGGSTGATYFQQAGTGKIYGDIVYFKVRLQINAKSTDTGVATIDLNDILFASDADNIDTVVDIHSNGITVSSGARLSGVLRNGTKIIYLYEIQDSTGARSTLDNTNFGTSDQIWISGHFFI